MEPPALPPRQKGARTPERRRPVQGGVQASESRLRASPDRSPSTTAPPAPPAAPPVPRAILEDLPSDRPDTADDPVITRKRHQSVSVASFDANELQHGALLRGIRSAAVSMLKQTGAAGKAAGTDTEGRAWPTFWHPHARAPISMHKGSVNSCRVYARGSRVLSCGDDGELHVADLSSGMRIGRPLKGHDGPVKDCRVLSDQKHALSCGEDGTLKIWRLMTAEEQELAWSDCHTQQVNSIDIYEANGVECALSASNDGTLKVWELETGRCTATLRATDEDGKPNKSEVESCCVYKTPNGEWEALSGGADNHVRRWVLTGPGAGTEMKHAGTSSPWMAKQDTLKGRNGHQGVVRGCCASHDGKHALTCSGDRTAIFWDLTTGSVIRSLKHTSSVFGCSFLPGEKMAMTVSSHAPLLWDVYSGECVRIFAGHTGDPLHCCVMESTKLLTCGNGGSIRVWDLSAHDNTATVGTTATDDQQHQHIVKEIVVFPDGSKALSCSYDKTAKVWCLRTGCCIVTLAGHGSSVNECCVFPDGKKVLTASKDGTLKIWGWQTVTKSEKGLPLGECQLTVGREQHTASGRPDEIRGCGIFDNGRKVFSCSKAGKICLFEVTFDGHDRAIAAKFIKNLDGHKGLVDRCCVFSSDTRMISASWDKTCKIWDLETATCLFTCKDENKVRGVAVYDNDTKAVCCGSGQWLSIWDISTGLLLNRVDMQHRSTVWGLCLMSQTVRLSNDGVWSNTHVAITYSGDGFVKFWALTHGVEREIVHARRAFDPGPMCVAVVPPSFELGNLSLLVGGFKSIKMNDVSSIGSGPSAGSIWEGSKCIEPGITAEWLLDTVMENSAHFLYFRNRYDDLPTLIHKLANSHYGYSILHTVLQEFIRERFVIIQGKPFDEGEHGKALGTIGILSRAGASPLGSALAVAVEGSFEDMAQLLLEDYRAHIATFQYVGAGFAPATLVLELTEADIVHLFSSFPVLAAEFLQLLPMQATSLVSPDSKCDFSAATNERFIRATVDHSPLVVHMPDGTMSQWWDSFIDKQWYQSELKDSAKLEKWRGQVAQESHKLRPADTAWGVKIKAERVPLIAGGFQDLVLRKARSKMMAPVDSESEQLSATMERAQTQSPEDTFISEETRQLFPGDGGPVKVDAIVEATMLRKMDLFGREIDLASASDVSSPPFSRLLQQACDHATKTGTPNIFQSQVLQAIVQYKWEGRSRRMYMTLVKGYVAFIISFTFVTLEIENVTECYRPGTHFKPENYEDTLVMGNITGCLYTAPELDADGNRVGYTLNKGYLAWYIVFIIMWLFSLAYNIVMTVHEWQQFMEEKRKYFASFWNWLDLISASVTFASMFVSLIFWIRDENDNVLLRSLDVLQAHALLLGWIKVLYFLRGLDMTSFLVNMLKMIVVDMAPFMIVLVVVLMAFAFSFNLMLRHDLKPPDTPSGLEEDTMFDNPVTSIFGVIGMMFGDFDPGDFRQALSDSHIGFGRDENISGPAWFSLIDLTFFLLVVPLVMLNALIAIMGDTYDRVKEDAEASKIHDRALIILEMEGMMEYKDDASHKNHHLDDGGIAKDGWGFFLRVLASAKLPYSDYPRYLHQLSKQTRRGEIEEISAQVKILSTSLHHLMDDVEQGERAAAIRQAETLKMVQEVRQDMQENMLSLQAHIDKILGSVQASSLAVSSAPLRPQPEPEPEPEPEPQTRAAKVK